MRVKEETVAASTSNLMKYDCEVLFATICLFEKAVLLQDVLLQVSTVFRHPRVITGDESWDAERLALGM